jgi:NAD(P)-dependent dehydrogenase (short-subunit alcohol dehydrogenase family)
VIGVDRDRDKLAKVDTELGPHFSVHVCDISKDAEITALAEFVQMTFGRLDVLVNNAGAGHFVSLELIAEADYLYHFDTLIKGPMFIVKNRILLLRKSKYESITSISSAAAIQ